MTRDEFRAAVFERDNYSCVVCHSQAQDAHHIIERRLWPDGGYHLDNGVALCGEHHMDAERTRLSPELLREYAGISKVLLPYTMDHDTRYDKWGNPYLPDGRRVAGELFYDPSVQLVLRDQLDSFTRYVKYPRTPHLPWSPGVSKDDINWDSDKHLVGREVVVTEKMDGENTTMYNDHIHARALDDMTYDASRTWVKNLHGKIAHEIPESYRIVGENLFAEHSIHYTGLPSYFVAFSVWDAGRCLNWDATIEWLDLLGLTPAPVLYRGEYSKEALEIELDTTKQEGYVVRVADEFLLHEFRRSVAKWVRPNHITTDRHWRWKQITPNELA